MRILLILCAATVLAVPSQAETAVKTDDETRKMLIDGCVTEDRTSTAESCGCLMKGLETIYTQAEYDQMVEQVRRGEKPSVRPSEEEKMLELLGLSVECDEKSHSGALQKACTAAGDSEQICWCQGHGLREVVSDKAYAQIAQAVADGASLAETDGVSLADLKASLTPEQAAEVGKLDQIMAICRATNGGWQGASYFYNQYPE